MAYIYMTSLMCINTVSQPRNSVYRAKNTVSHINSAYRLKDTGSGVGSYEVGSV